MTTENNEIDIYDFRISFYTNFIKEKESELGSVRRSNEKIISYALERYIEDTLGDKAAKLARVLALESYNELNLYGTPK